MTNLYDEDYYERGIETGKSGYSNFRWIPELTIPMCHHIIENLDINPNDTILDFGCGKGYMVKAMRLLGRKSWGVDISEYAINNSDNETKPFLYLNDIILQNDVKYDWIISKDVFEHISYNNIINILSNIKNSCKHLFCIIPLGKNGKYVVPSYELDITHIIREDLEWWVNIFKQVGFMNINSGYSMDGIKSNYMKYENGNGFFSMDS